MPSGTYRGKADALCPFYRFDDGQKRRIVCEGIVDGSTLASTFRTRNDYEIQLSVFCCEHYKKCEMYQTIMKTKYEDDEN